MLDPEDNAGLTGQLAVQEARAERDAARAELARVVQALAGVTIALGARDDETSLDAARRVVRGRNAYDAEVGAAARECVAALAKRDEAIAERDSANRAMYEARDEADKLLGGRRAWRAGRLTDLAAELREAEAAGYVVEVTDRTGRVGRLVACGADGSSVVVTGMDLCADWRDPSGRFGVRWALTGGAR